MDYISVNVRHLLHIHNNFEPSYHFKQGELFQVLINEKELRYAKWYHRENYGDYELKVSKFDNRVEVQRFLFDKPMFNRMLGKRIEPEKA